MEKINWFCFKEIGNPVLESYRIIRANFLDAMSEKNAKCIAFTSPCDKTTNVLTSVVAGLAVALAQNGKRTLLIDGNLVTPSFHEFFSIENKGIADGLTEGADLCGLIQHCEEQKLLDVLTSGVVTAHMGEIISSDRMKDFLSVMSEAYEYVLMVLPPVDVNADAIVMGSKVDAVVLVLTIGQDTVGMANTAKTKLEKAGAFVAGCITKK